MSSEVEVCGAESGSWVGSNLKGESQFVRSETCNKPRGHDGWHKSGDWRSGSTWAPKETDKEKEEVQ